MVEGLLTQEDQLVKEDKVTARNQKSVIYFKKIALFWPFSVTNYK